MDRKNAEAVLSLDGDSSEKAVREAYLARVKDIRNETDFEQQLQQLNVARDRLLEASTDGRELVPALAKELAEITAKQNNLALANDAREEIRNTFNTIERHAVNKIKGTRDLTGLLSAASAALAFGRENLSEFLPSLAGSTPYSQTLLITSACLAFMAFMANRRAVATASKLDEINQSLTRDRQINRLLGNVFHNETSLTEREFEEHLLSEIQKFTGARHERSELSRVLEIYGALGVPVPVRIHLGYRFADDYIDYLIKSGRITTTGTSGNDMMVHKAI